MPTKNFGIHISLVAIHREKTCAMTNDKRQPSMLLRVAGLTSTHGPHVCPGTLCAEGTNILLLVAMPVRTNQLHATPTLIFFLESVSAELRHLWTPSSSRNLKFSTQEKTFWKINIPSGNTDLNNLRCRNCVPFASNGTLTTAVQLRQILELTRVSSQ